MKSVVELEINAPQSKVASLFMDPNNNPKWMDEIDRIEAVSGTPGEPGSVYRMVPKRDDLEFVATVVAKDPPVELRLSLVGHNTSVSVIARLRKAAEGRTTLISEETICRVSPSASQRTAGFGGALECGSREWVKLRCPGRCKRAAHRAAHETLKHLLVLMFVPVVFAAMAARRPSSTTGAPY